MKLSIGLRTRRGKGEEGAAAFSASPFSGWCWESPENTTTPDRRHVPLSPELSLLFQARVSARLTSGQSVHAAADRKALQGGRRTGLSSLGILDGRQEVVLELLWIDPEVLQEIKEGLTD